MASRHRAGMVEGEKERVDMTGGRRSVSTADNSVLPTGTDGLPNVVEQGPQRTSGFGPEISRSRFSVLSFVT
jgi:hypothetical protein